MSSISISKFKAMLPFSGGGSDSIAGSKPKRFMEKVDPEVGFEMLLVPSQSRKDGDYNGNAKVAELHVKILGARHLPSIFGLKSVEGYVVKVYTILV